MSPEDLRWARAEFDRCAPFLQRAIDRGYGNCDLAYVWTRIQNGSAQIWPMPNSCVVTTVEVYPNGLRALFVWLAGGKLSELKARADVISEWARKADCKQIVTDGREGWGRIFGARKHSVRYVKDI